MNQCREQTALFQYINEVSFAINDMNLYLDTHPEDKKALAFMEEHVKMRKRALKEYAMKYGPLTIDTTDNAAMIAITGYFKYLDKDFCSIDLPAYSRVTL